MAVILQQQLFGWKQIDTVSDLDRLKLVLEVLPDEKFVNLLEKKRAQGRDDYPIRPCWNALIAGIIYQHQSVASLLRELWRNGELRQLCGFDPHRGAEAIPTAFAFSRFLNLVIKSQNELIAMFHQLTNELAVVLPDLGIHLAADSKAIKSAGKPVKDETKHKQSDGRRDIDADWGCKSYKGQRADGTNWEKIIKWFGYKVHLIVDSKYELPLAFKLTKASVGDPPELLPLVEQLKNKQPVMYQRESKILTADKGYDSNENNRVLHQEHGIIPVIDKRTMWKQENTKPLNVKRADTIIYNEDGEVFCIDPETEQQRQMAFMGFEAKRGTLKYRCPMKARGKECVGHEFCEHGHKIGKFGRVVRVPLETDYRIFTPIARHTNKWKKTYNMRTAVERVNSRLDRVLGFEEHFIRGFDKMQTRVTLGLIAMLAMALGRIRANQSELMRSLTMPIKRLA
jgi:hypothetical protein